MAILKPIKPLENGAGTQIYPLTHASQVVCGEGENKRRLEQDGLINADQLNGKNASEYVLHNDALTLEEIKASTNLAGKIPEAEALKSVVEMLGQGKFDSAYNLQQTGVSVPDPWGAVIRVAGQNWGVEFRTDSYFLLIGSGGDLFTGIQVNGATDVTWNKLARG